MIVVNRKERDRLLRREDILKAAEHVFAVRGYHNATMQDIAKKAQYATGTVYLYFKDKESLYYSLIEEKITGFAAFIKEKTASIDDVGRKLEVFIEESLEYCEKNQDFFRLFITERSKFQWVTVSRPSRLDELPFLVELMREGQRQNLLRDDYDARRIADILISILISFMFDWLKQESSEAKGLKDVSHFIFDMFLNGARKK